MYCETCQCEKCEWERELAYRRKLEEEERSRGRPPSWTAEQRARLAITLRRPEVREKIRRGQQRAYERRKNAAQQGQGQLHG